MLLQPWAPRTESQNSFGGWAWYDLYSQLKPQLLLINICSAFKKCLSWCTWVSFCIVFPEINSFIYIKFQLIQSGHHFIQKNSLWIFHVSFCVWCFNLIWSSVSVMLQSSSDRGSLDRTHFGASSTVPDSILLPSIWQVTSILWLLRCLRIHLAITPFVFQSWEQLLNVLMNSRQWFLLPHKESRGALKSGWVPWCPAPMPG